jgi:thiol:disulfide interchange protein DsbA
VRYLIAILTTAAMIAAQAYADAPQFEENVNYELIQPAPAPAKPGEKIEVTEFFMWGCPHCYHFESFLKKWRARQPKDVEFVRIPAMFGGSANMHAKAYYALQAIGALDEDMNDAFFNEIHEKHNRLKTREALDAFVASQGVDMDKFRAAMDSFAVAAKANRAAVLMRRYGIRAVPALVVDGRYKSGRGMNFKELIELADYLVERVRQERLEASK